MNHSKFILCLLLICLTIQSVWSQSPVIRGRNMKVTEQAVSISDVQIDVQLLGSLARTTVSLSIYNPNDRILEGEFNFPLADGQSISQFALDIDGKMREGVAVDKAKAQQFFESIVRRRVDPGLIEKTQGNNFRSRVYPIPPQGSRKIRIAYEQELPLNGDNYTYTLPFYYGEGINLSINIEASGYTKKPAILQSLSRKLKFKKQDSRFVAQYHQKKQKKIKPVVIAIPVDNTVASLIQTDTKTNEKMFYSRVFPSMHCTEIIYPKKMALYWDASLSMEKKDIKKEISLLDKYFKQVGNAEIDLYTFAISLSEKASFKVSNGNWDELKKVLLAVRYDGATFVNKLDFSRTDVDAILLFSDGINNFGEGTIPYKKTPVFTVNSVARADHSALKYISVASGGKYINLLIQDVDKAANAMLAQNIRLISAEYNQDEIADLAFLQYIPNAETGFSITGTLKVPHTTIQLHFGIGNRILESKQIRIAASEAMETNNILKRVWAQKRIADLEIIYDVNKEEIEALGRAHNIVTRNTSLIVLEDLSDYVEFRISPPEELLEQYNKAIDKLDAQVLNAENVDRQIKEANRLQEIEFTVDLLNRKKEWWVKEFPRSKRPQATIHFTPPVIVEMSTEEGSDDALSIDIADLQAHQIIMIEDRATESGGSRAEREDFIPENREKEERTSSRSKSPTIRLKDWDPDMPYIKALNSASNENIYDTYHAMRNEYREMPSFYIDASILMHNRGLRREALLVLSNLAEIQLENHSLLRVLAHRLLHTNHTEEALYQFEVVKRLRPDEPQSFRDLALAYDRHGAYQKALDGYLEVIETPFSRFEDIKLYAAEEMNNLIERARKQHLDLDTSKIDPRLLGNMPVDIRVIMSWDSDNTDIDLWVTDPHNQHCYYGNRETYNGGMYFSDFTGGYGPESYQIREAIKGNYKITAKYFANHSQSLTGPTSIYLDIFTGYATDDEKKETIIVRLDNAKDELVIGEVTY